MTRINSHIKPTFLSDEHLLAEHREIKRIPHLLQKSLCCNKNIDIPKTFCLGQGHVKFFYNKVLFLYDRYKSIHNECVKRGFNVCDYSNNFLQFNNTKYWNNWDYDENSCNTVKQRIIDRIVYSKKQYFHYNGNKISKDKTINLLKSN